jgi:hypothetical protein
MWLLGMRFLIQEMVGSDGEEGDEPDDARNWVYEVDKLDDQDLDDEGASLTTLKRYHSIMPSAIGKDHLATDCLKALASQEMKLCEGQANDSLEAFTACSWT